MRKKNWINLMKRSLFGLLLPLYALILPWGAMNTALAQYADWKHKGTLILLTTSNGANLPASAREENFPVLVRLNSDTFDFKQAGGNGSDIRFSSKGKPLAFQVDHWDADKGEASIWVRIPVIRGNERQEIKLHWGKAGAISGSNGNAVFNDSNG
ncbi:MAG: DUF2341 domain-containing protein, partial [Verrucomicrobiia bacterium]